MTCIYCDTKDGPFHLDHVVPRSRGGTDDPANIVTACASCNMQKSDRLPSEWFADNIPPAVLLAESLALAASGLTVATKGPRHKRRQGTERSASNCVHGGHLGAQILIRATADSLARWTAAAAAAKIPRSAWIVAALDAAARRA